MNIRTTDEVLKYDVQLLFGKAMKSTEIIQGLLPQPVYVTSPIEESSSEDVLPTLDDWLKGLCNE